MKKQYIIWIIISIALIIGVISGIVLWVNSKNISDLDAKTKSELAERQILESNGEYNTKVVSTIVNEEKTSPLAQFIFKTNYTDCNHTTKIIEDMPKEFVNKTKEEIQELYKDWKIESFSPTEIIFSIQKEGICEEHYVLKEKEGYIAIYKLDIYGNEILQEITSIITAYLPDTDKIRLEEGIKVEGKEKLNSTIEDYE